jgi:PAS domain S-box-containing protein
MERTSGLLDAVCTPVLVLTRDGRIQQFNRACAGWLGDPSGQPDDSFWRLLPLGDPDVNAAAERFQAGDFPIDLECDVTTPVGTVRIAWSLCQEGDDIVATGIDATRWHRKLEALRVHEERLRSLFNAMPDPVFLKDEGGRWIEANPAGLAVFDLMGVDYRGQTDAELGERRPFYREALRGCTTSDEKAWASGELTRGEERIPTPEGGRARTYDTFKSPLFRPDGTRKGLVVLSRDISERGWAEEALRQSEAQLRLILETAPDLIGLIGADGKVQFVNRAAEALLGVPRDEIIGHSFDEPQWAFSGPGGRVIALEDRPFQRAQKEGLVRGIELEFDPRDGRRVVVLAVNAAALAEPKGAVVFAATDVTRRHEVERLKSEFLNVASHELRAPLTPLCLLLERSRIALRGGIDVDASTLARMDHQVERLTHLIDELLDVARLERGHFVGAPRSAVDLGALVRDVVSDFRLQARAAIAVDVPPDAAVVFANRSALERVVSNLVDNAVKYGGKEVEVKVTATNDDVGVSVRDHGLGIAPEQRVNLFERFYRVGTEATVRHPGLGLGLFISRELVRELGSDIDFETEVGRGSAFRFTLPRHVDG